MRDKIFFFYQARQYYLHLPTLSGPGGVEQIFLPEHGVQQRQRGLKEDSPDEIRRKKIGEAAVILRCPGGLAAVPTIFSYRFCL